MLVGGRQGFEQRSRQGIDHQRRLRIALQSEPVDQPEAFEPAELGSNRFNARGLAGCQDDSFRYGQLKEKGRTQQRGLLAGQRLPIDVERELLKEVADVAGRCFAACVEAFDGLDRSGSRLGVGECRLGQAALQARIAATGFDAAGQQLRQILGRTACLRLGPELLGLLALVHRRKRYIGEPCAQIIASGIGEREAIAARQQQMRSGVHIREGLDDGAQDRDVIVPDRHRFVRLRRAQDLLQIVDDQQDRLPAAGRVVCRAGAFEDLAQGIAERRGVLLHRPCPGPTEFTLCFGGKRIQNLVEDGVCPVGIEHHDGLVVWKPVATRAARLDLPSRPMHGSARRCGRRCRPLCPERYRGSAALGACGRRRCAGATGTFCFCRGTLCSQPTSAGFAEAYPGADRSAAIAAQVDPREVPVPALLLLRIAHQSAQERLAGDRGGIADRAHAASSP